MYRFIRLISLTIIILILVSCVSLPEPSPFQSPQVRTFESPLLTYFPFIISEPYVNKIGISQALNTRNCETVQQVGATWHWDWSPNPLDCPGVEAIPMVWAPGDGFSKPIYDSEYLLVFNECDLIEQCDTDPTTAATWWHTYEELYPTRKLVGPNISHYGFTWLLEWHDAYIRLYGKQPRMWALGIHCYMDSENCKVWVNKNAILAQSWTQSKKIWLTEWAMPFEAGADNFMRWILENPNIERESWFIAHIENDPTQRWSQLIDKNGALTELGKWHVEIAQEYKDKK